MTKEITVYTYVRHLRGLGQRRQVHTERIHWRSGNSDTRRRETGAGVDRFCRPPGTDRVSADENLVSLLKRWKQ